MEGILDFEGSLVRDPKLQSTIQELIKLIVEEKRFRFKKEEMTFDIASLEENNILISNEQYLVVADSAVFYSELYNHFSEKLSYTLSPKVENIFLFTKAVEKDLAMEGYRPGVSSFFESFRTFVLFLTHKSYYSDFVDYILGLNIEESGQNLYFFKSSYCNLIPYLNTPVGTIYKNLKLLTQVLADPSVRFNGNIGEIRRAVISFCHVDSDKGEKMLEYAVAQEDVTVDLDSAIIQGLYIHQRSVLWPRIEMLSKNKKWRLSVLLGLSGAPALTELEGEQHYGLIETLTDPTEGELLNLPQMLRSIITAQEVNVEVKKKCFAKLEELITNPNQNFRHIVLSDLSIIEEFDSERIKIIKRLILTTDFEQNQTPAIGAIFRNNKSLLGFVEILHLYADKFRLDFEPKDFSSAFHNFSGNQPEDFSLELIKLLTHDKGEIRFIGKRILYHLAPHHGSYILHTDILKLDAMTQCKLCEAILSGTREPKSSLPILLSLLDTTFQLVIEIFIQKLEIMIEEYGNAVIETLEAKLDLENPHYNAVYLHLKNYNEEFWALVSKKEEVKELNPYCTQSELYLLFFKNYSNKFNKSLSENVGKNSFLMSLTTTVILAKGGGWKNEMRSEVTKLGHVSTSYQLPRSYFIAPEAFDWNLRMSTIENWNKKYAKWEAITLS